MLSGILTGLGLGGLAVSMAAKDYLTDLIVKSIILCKILYNVLPGHSLIKLNIFSCRTEPFIMKVHKDSSN